jgi:hypothetical protein
MPYTSTHIKTKKLKQNNQTYIGFYLTDLYTNKSLNKLINNVNNFNHSGLTYFNQIDLPKSILQVL